MGAPCARAAGSGGPADADSPGALRIADGDAVTLRDYASLDAPVLLLAGEDTRASARRMAELLEYALPSVEFQRLPGLGHLGPVTHADAVAERIAFFVRRQTETRVAGVREAA